MTAANFIRLPNLVKLINAKVLGYSATMEKSFTSTDRKYAGQRYRFPGKGRNGNKVTIRNADGVPVMEHDSSKGGGNDGFCFWIEQTWGPIWNEEIKHGRNLVCRSCRATENAETRGHYTYHYITVLGFLCPSCNAKSEAGTLKT